MAVVWFTVMVGSWSLAAVVVVVVVDAERDDNAVVSLVADADDPTRPPNWKMTWTQKFSHGES